MNEKNTSRLSVSPITQLNDYIQNGEILNALKYIDSMTDKRLLTVTDNKNMTPMMYACKKSLEEVAVRILSSGFSNLSQVSITGKTAFIYACSNDMNRVAILIIESGNNFKPAQADEDLCTALMWCCANSMTDVAIKLILTDKNLNYGQQDREGDTALMIACSRNLNQLTITMIRTGRSHPEIVNDENVSALMIAIYNGMIETSIALIKTGMSVPETVSDHDQTALIIACRGKLHDTTEEHSNALDTIILELLMTDCNIEYIDNYNHSAFDYYVDNYIGTYDIPNYGNTEILLLFVHYYYHNNQTSDVFIRNMEIICNTPLLRAIVKHGIPGIQIDKFCETPVPVNTGDVSFAPLAEVKYDENTDDKSDKDTKSKKRKNESIVDADEIHLTTAIPEDDDYYTNENGERVQVPVMSQGEGVLIPKRIGGKRKMSKKRKGKEKSKGKSKGTKTKSKKINRKKRFNKKTKTNKKQTKKTNIK